MLGPSDDIDITSGRFVFDDTSMCRDDVESTTRCSTMTDVPDAAMNGTTPPDNTRTQNTMIARLGIPSLSGDPISLNLCDTDNSPDIEGRFLFGESDNDLAGGDDYHSDDGSGEAEDDIAGDAPHAQHIDVHFCFDGTDSEGTESENDDSEDGSGEVQDDIHEGGADSSPDETTVDNRPRGSFTAASFAHIPDDEFA